MASYFIGLDFFIKPEFTPAQIPIFVKVAIGP